MRWKVPFMTWNTYIISLSGFTLNIWRNKSNYFNGINLTLHWLGSLLTEWFQDMRDNDTRGKWCHKSTGPSAQRTKTCEWCVAMTIPWRHGSPRTGCCDFSLAACSSSASGCQGYWCTASWLWSCDGPTAAPLIAGDREVNKRSRIVNTMLAKPFSLTRGHCGWVLIYWAEYVAFTLTYYKFILFYLLIYCW